MSGPQGVAYIWNFYWAHTIVRNWVELWCCFAFAVSKAWFSKVCVLNPTQEFLFRWINELDRCTNALQNVFSKVSHVDNVSATPMRQNYIRQKWVCWYAILFWYLVAMCIYVHERKWLTTRLPWKSILSVQRTHAHPRTISRQTQLLGSELPYDTDLCLALLNPSS